MAVYGKQADVDANQGKDVLLYVPGQTKLTSKDTFLGGTGTGVTDEQLNGAKRIAGYDANQTAQLYADSLKFKPQQEMANMQGTARSLADASYSGQKAQLQKALQDQIGQLQTAYDNAISEGKISVRDAQDAFNTQKSAIEKQAYQDAERTALVGNELGIQNSQQLLGLMSGDNARTNSLINENMTTRDKRIADISDRIKNLKNQNDVSLANANATYNYGLASAKAQSDAQYAQQVLGLQQSNYEANLNQMFNEQNMATQNKYQLGQMATQQGYTRDNMALQQGYDLDKMKTQNEFDMNKLAQSFANDLKMASVQYGYSSSLQGQAHANAMSEYAQKATMEMAQEQKQYEISRDRELAKYQEGTPEYDIAKGQMDSAFNQSMTKEYAGYLAKENIDSIFGNPALGSSQTTAPIYSDSWMVNKINGYDAKKAEYDAYQKALDRKKSFLSGDFSSLNK